MIARRPAPLAPEPLSIGSQVMDIRDVIVYRGARPILNGVSLQIRTGEILALVGPNGAGKSTLLQVLGGDESPAAGETNLFGRPVRGWSARDAALRRAFLPQHNTLAFPFTVRDVVAMGRSPWRGLAESAMDDEIIDEVLAEVAVTELASRRFTSLSGGEAGRVSLARALAQRSPVLLLDEPTAALDPHHQEQVFALLRRLADSGSAVVVVVHELNLAAGYADRVAVLGRGCFDAVGAPAQVLTAEILTETYQHEMEVITHPRTGLPLIGPRR